MTEDEAKKKWCPMVRQADMQGSLNRDADDRPLGMCIASDCMMWKATDNEGSPSYPGDLKAKYKPAGYCGLSRQ